MHNVSTFKQNYFEGHVNKFLLYLTLCCIFILFSRNGYATKYDILGVASNEHTVREATALNDKGQIVGYASDIGMIFINHNGKIIPIDKNHHHSSVRAINNNGEVLVRAIHHDHVESYIWNKPNRKIPLNVFNSKKISALDFNDSREVIGSYIPDKRSKKYHGGKKRPFLWRNGKAFDFGPQFIYENAFNPPESYDIVEVKLISINNSGDIAGYCLCLLGEGEGGLVKEKGYIPFFWDGLNVTFLPIIEKNENALLKMKLNNEMLIVIPYENETYLWEAFKIDGQILPTNCNHELYHALSIPNFRAECVNDKGEIFGLLRKPRNQEGASKLIETYSYALWNPKENTMSCLSDLLSDRLQFVPNLGHFVDINNKGQILCHFFSHTNDKRLICILHPIAE